jgi:hypothetical protein
VILQIDGLAVADQPCNGDVARSLEPFLAAGFSDREAWESLFTDRQRLAWFRFRHGNCPSSPRPPSLFDLTEQQHPGAERVRASGETGA